MLNSQLINPESIVVVGGSNNIHKPGGKILKNIIDGNFTGKLFITNPKHDLVQGVKSYQSVEDIPDDAIQLAILAIPAAYCPQVMEELAEKKATKAFIVISAGFSEESEAGAEVEKQMVEIVNRVNGCLIGPNCIGVLNRNHHSIFTTPIPKLDPEGCDFISGSGATAVFIIESGIPKGLTFSSVYSVGNSAQIGVEDVLKFMDENFDPKTDSKIKLLYIETINNPDMLLKHAESLISKGCRIAAIKAGISDAGKRAASSHTGALASSELAVDALFRKAGIVRCFGREELVTVASIFMHRKLKGKNIAIITHAGGPAVMLTDALSDGGMAIPKINGEKSDELLEKLHPGASVSNPIDLLATGNAEQLGIVIDYCNMYFDNIDAMMVIFGSPGLHEVFDAYEVLHKKMLTSPKPIFPILPSVITAKREVDLFLSHRHVNFPDEVILGRALTKVYNTPEPVKPVLQIEGVDIAEIREIIDQLDNGYIAPRYIQALLDAAGIPRVTERVIKNKNEAVAFAQEIGYPVVMKVVGPVHKTDVDGVILDIKSEERLRSEFDRMMKIKDTRAILIQPMQKGTELFIGAKYESKFGHIILCGLGGIFVEVLQDVSSGLAPLTFNEAISMIRSLRSYKMFVGVRGKQGISEHLFADIMVRLSILLRHAVEIKEMDLNPLIGREESIIVVDSRIRIEK